MRWSMRTGLVCCCWVLLVGTYAWAAEIELRPHDVVVNVPGGSSSTAAVTDANPRGGFGSLELLTPAASEGAIVAVGLAAPLGVFADLQSVAFDWYIDGASTLASPPTAAVCFYSDADPRFFCLASNACPAPCTDRTTDAWQTSSNPTSDLEIVPLGPDAPTSLNDIDPDAPIVSLVLTSLWSNLTSWHGFVDQVAIGLGGSGSTTFNFETWAGELLVYPGDPGWAGTAAPPSSVARISGYAPRSGLGSLELAGTGDHGATFVTGGALWDFGTFGDLNELSVDWFVDPASTSIVHPDVSLRIYPEGDPKTFWLRWDTSGPPPSAGVWHHSSLLGSLVIEQAEGDPPPPTVGDIPANAPITQVHLRRIAGDYYRGCVDDLSVGFTGHQPLTFNFEVVPVFVDDFEGGGLCNWTLVVPEAICP